MIFRFGFVKEAKQKVKIWLNLGKLLCFMLWTHIYQSINKNILISIIQSCCCAISEKAKRKSELRVKYTNHNLNLSFIYIYLFTRIMTDSGKKNICEECSKAGIMQCGNCKSVFYWYLISFLLWTIFYYSFWWYLFWFSSREHQIKNW